MNTLSWFVYFTGISDKLSSFFGVIGTIMVLIGLGLTALSFIYEEQKKMRDNATSQYHYDIITIHPLEFLRPPAFIVLFFAFIIIISSVLIPPKDVLYMIAASQVGEQIVQLEQVQEIGGEVGGLAKDTIDLLRQNIQEQLVAKPVEAD